MIDFTHLHPMIVHFPIALLIVGFLTDAAGLIIKRDFFVKAGFYLLILGSLGTITALLTGERAGDGIVEQGMLKQALERHEDAAVLTVWLVSITAVARVLLVLLKKYTGFFKIGFLVLYMVAVAALGRTGYYGGKLVYENAAGVQFNLGADFGSDDFGDED